ncbi:MAG TPA: hypothetical protein VLR92_03685, partial [Blastocatellia bacterium]|nr:hypothetical protein [Blastocatellia bacterium]
MLAQNQNDNYGSYDISWIPELPGIGGGLGFDPTNAAAWQQALQQAITNGSYGIGGSGTVGKFDFTGNGGGPRTFTITVRPFGAGLEAVPAVLYVYTRDADGNPTVLSFPTGGSEPQTYNITYGDTGTQTYSGSISFAIVPTESSGGLGLSAGARLLKSLGIIDKLLPFGTSRSLPSTGYDVQVFAPGFGPRSENDSFDSSTFGTDYASAADTIVTGAVTATNVTADNGVSIDDNYVDNSLDAEFLKEANGKNSALIYNAQTTQDVALWTSDNFNVDTSLQNQPHLTIVASRTDNEVDFSFDPTIEIKFGALDTSSTDDRATIDDIEAIVGSSTDEVTLYNVYRVKGSVEDDVFDVDLSGISNAPFSIDGNGGTDAVNIQGFTGPLTLTVAAAASGGDTLTITGSGVTGFLNSIENINLGAGAHIVDVNSLGSQRPSDAVTIDLGATLYSSVATLDFSQFAGNVNLGGRRAQDGQHGAELFLDKNFTNTSHYSFQNFNTLNLGAGDDNINLTQADDPYLHVINTGGGNDTITSGNINVTINLQGSNDTVLHAGKGSVINIGKNTHATIVTSDDVLIENLKPTDIVKDANGNILHGALGSPNSEGQWVYSYDGTGYGLNSLGELGIKDVFGNITYLANYVGVPDVSYANQMAGIFVGTISTWVWSLAGSTVPLSSIPDQSFKAANDILFTMGLQPIFNADP